MKNDLRPEVVAARLAALRAIASLESPADAQARMARPPRVETFEDAVARRLSELRALCDLTARLHRSAP